MNLFDCFLDDYHDEKYVASLVNLDIRAQLEVRTMNVFHIETMSVTLPFFREFSSSRVCGHWEDH